MMRRIDTSACCNRWKDQAEAVLVLCLGLMSCVFMLPPWPGACLVTVTAMVAALLAARVSARTYFGALALPMGFLIVSAVGLSVTFHGSDTVSFTFSDEGLQTALQTSLRALAGLSVTTLFACTVAVPRWIGMLQRLGVPSSLLDLIVLTYRTLFLLDEARASLLRAQHNRLGYAFFVRSLHSTAMMGAALLLRSITCSQRLERGLIARNYSGEMRVLLPPSETRARHLLGALLVPVFLCLIVHCIPSLG